MTSQTSKAPTLRDVARLAGVHPATASRALTGTRTVNPTLVRQVRKAAETLGYRVNPIGRALKQRTTGMIGMVVPDITNPFFPALVRAVESALAAESRALFLCDSSDDVDIERDRIEALISRQVDGLIISSVHAVHSKPALEAAAARLPLVQVDRLVDGIATDAVVADQRQMMNEVVAHLRSRGCRRFCLVTSEHRISSVIERVAAYRDVFADDPESRDAILRGDLTSEWGTRAGEAITKGPGPLPDAIVCANDLIAVSVLGALRSHGINVPEQVKVVGFDNTTMAASMSPKLTSVHQPIDQIGREAVQMLGHRGVDLRQPARRFVLAGTLIVRESS